MTKRRALICSYAPPRPDRDSGSRRTWHFIEFLREAGWDVSFLAASRIIDAQYTRDLLREGMAVYDGEVDKVEDLFASGGFDLAICSFWQVADLYLPLIRRLSPSTCVLLDSVDLQFVRDSRRLFSRPAGPAWMLDADYGAQTASELNAYAAADGVLAVSAEEARLVNGLLAGATLAHWVPDAEDLPRSRVPVPERAGILFVGSFRHAPNLDALEYLCGEIVPLLDDSLLERHPISIVGDGFEETMQELVRGLPHVRPVGWVPSLAPYLDHARITIVPLRYGAGTKRKLIQALMVGAPTVATSIGVEGLDLVPGREVLVADDAKSFAESIARLLRDDELWRRLSRLGRARIVRNHSLEAVRQRFLNAIEEAIDRPRKTALLPVVGRDRYHLHTAYQENQKLMAGIRRICRESVPPDATVSVVTGGSAELLRIEGREARHFPPDATGEGVGGNPEDSEAAIAVVEDAIRDGADFLLVPRTFSWWLTYYPDLVGYLERFEARYEDECALFRLREPRPQAEAEHDVESPGGALAGRTAIRPDQLPAKLIAFYLPQFHRIPENDEWWGEGFTEWTNVARAQPLFPGHYQPHLPADLGFYDLRSPETREAQAQLAREAGITGFCYYHYWFSGKRLLERPFDEVLASGQPDFPFCLCWANEPWTRRWDGGNEDVLQPQAYSRNDDREHIRWLLPALTDPRAITVDGKPLFLVYQAKELPDPARTTDLWRREARKAGLPGLHLVCVETGWDAGWDATRVGFDAKVLFQPQFSILLSVPQLEVQAPETLRVFDYEQAWPVLSNPDPVPYRRYETVCAGWDNTPRTGVRGWLLDGSTPEAYEAWLRQAIERARREPPDQRLVFLNAWNEWAEGAHLEPDERHGRAYLDATRRALDTAAIAEAPAARAPAVAVADRDPPFDPLVAVDPPRARALAFYLPQFHPIPENDEWWGRGFTEWTNVSRARPLFPGHYQPHLPAQLGFYDLRVAEVREQQAALAAEHGIEGFCYWHYWFVGKRLLERPFEEVLASGTPELPFCLAWANETWSRRWLGEERDILVKQEYSPLDDLEHIRWLLPAFADPRWIRVQERPLFLVYSPARLPDPKRTTELWRSECVAAGLPEPFLLGINAHRELDYRQLGFDGTVNFEPQLGAVVDPLSDGLKVVDYAEARLRMRRVRQFPIYPTVVVSWDNTPRRGEHGVVFTDSTPEAFEEGLREAVASLAPRPLEDRLLFVNAWNEWAEGNHLEPDVRIGLGHLEAVRRVILEPTDLSPAELAGTASGAKRHG